MTNRKKSALEYAGRTPFEIAQLELMRMQPDGPPFGEKALKEDHGRQVPVRGGVTSIGFLLPGGRIDNCMGYACNGFLGVDNSPYIKAQALWVFQEAHPDEAIKAWIGWLVGPDSPWIELIRAQPEQDLDFVINYGFVMTNLHFPANWVCNFFKIWRMGIEYKNRVDAWYETVRLGANPKVAGYLAGMTMAKKGVKNFTLARAMGHSWNEPAYGTLPVLKNFVNQKYSKEHATQDFFDNTNYYPCDVIWGRNKKSVGFYEQSQKFLQEKASLEISKRRFKSPREGEGVEIVAPEAWVEFCNYIEKEVSK